MPLSKSQKMMVHMAKAACALEDAEYREVWSSLFPGVTSSTDTRLGDEHFDLFMKYMEAIHWRKRNAGEVGYSKVFQYPHYWKEKNTKASTSRDRHNLQEVQGDCDKLEQQIMALGFGHGYINAISRRVLGANPTVAQWFQYRQALSRTLASKLKEKEDKEVSCPF
jgi:hypothetical protein